jgi:acetyl-CoA synthetase
MSDLYPVPAEWAAKAKVNDATYKAMYARSIDDAHAFWLDQAKRLDWVTFPTRTNESSFHEADFGVKWFADGEINAAANSRRARRPGRDHLGTRHPHRGAAPLHLCPGA